MTSEDHNNEKYTILERYFGEPYKIHDGHGRLIEKVFHLPATGSKRLNRAVHIYPGYDGFILEPELKLVIEIATSMGYDIIGFDDSKMSITNDLRSPISARTLDNFNLATQTAVEHKSVQKIINKLDYNIGVRHSMASRVGSDTNISSPIVAASTDKEVLIQPFFMSPPDLVKSKNEIIMNDPTGELWEKLSNRTRHKKITREGFEFTSQWNPHAFDIGLPLNWIRMFKDYSAFINNIAYSLLPGDKFDIKKNSDMYKSLEYTLSVVDKNIFKGNERFLRFLLLALPQKDTDIVIGTDDESYNHLFNTALGYELKKRKPNRYNLHFIEGATHYIDNKLNEFANVISPILWEARNKVRGHK